jgi:hypothetical protein
VLTGANEDAGRRRQVVAPRRHQVTRLGSSAFAGGSAAAVLRVRFVCGWGRGAGDGKGRGRRAGRGA